ncbi:MAG: SUMF1/EgtB/PvdO family nonheme iron enzyme [Paramuribaculum sp.]|nr:SUMF1/EgtB/PvdO family nonheme iron enzyme [Paramuribaculum sp.]
MQDLRELAREVSVRLLGLSSGASNGNSGVGSGRGRGQNGQNRTFTVNGVTFEMVAVRGGSFMMGSNEGFPGEKPVHQETVRDFMIGKTEVTQELWRAVMGSNPSYFSGDRKPVEQVLWTDCIEFINRLNHLTGENFRLPTEAEWEYAARGGNKSRNYKYSGSDDLYLVGWFVDNSDDHTHDVGTLQANELGIYDMSGNVLEWTVDQWSADYDYNTPRDSSIRVQRGGLYFDDPIVCRVACRQGDTSSFTYFTLGLGFRLAL